MSFQQKPNELANTAFPNTITKNSMKFRANAPSMPAIEQFQQLNTQSRFNKSPSEWLTVRHQRGRLESPGPRSQNRWASHLTFKSFRICDRARVPTMDSVPTSRCLCVRLCPQLPRDNIQFVRKPPDFACSRFSTSSSAVHSRFLSNPSCSSVSNTASSSVAGLGSASSLCLTSFLIFFRFTFSSP